jgi:putative lipoic acid-binding regulatory protein
LPCVSLTEHTLFRYLGVLAKAKSPLALEFIMDMTKFKTLLDEQVNWPEIYTFKFVVKTDKKDQITTLLEEHSIEEKYSAKGNYVSITSKKMMSSSDEVVAVYHKLSTIEGVITL